MRESIVGRSPGVRSNFRSPSLRAEDWVWASSRNTPNISPSGRFAAGAPCAGFTAEVLGSNGGFLPDAEGFAAKSEFKSPSISFLRESKADGMFSGGTLAHSDITSRAFMVEGLDEDFSKFSDRDFSSFSASAAQESKPSIFAADLSARAAPTASSPSPERAAMRIFSHASSASRENRDSIDLSKLIGGSLLLHAPAVQNPQRRTALR